MTPNTHRDSRESGDASPFGQPSQSRTTVEVRATGHVRDALGMRRIDFTFEGDTLRELLDAFFAEYDVRDLIMAETEAEATAHGWAKLPGRPPGTWRKNPDGDQTRAYARVCVNGRFNENLDGLDTKLVDGDRSALIRPFMFCC